MSIFFSGSLFIQAMFASGFVVMKRRHILGIVCVFGHMVDHRTSVYLAIAEGVPHEKM